MEAKLRDVEKKLEVQEEQTRLAEHRNSRLESILKKEIVRSSRLKRALLELVGSSNEILDHMLCEQETRRNNSERTHITYLYSTGRALYKRDAEYGSEGDISASQRLH